MDNTADVWQLVARVLNNEASPEEQGELAAILRSDESLQQQYDLLTRIWKEKAGNSEYPDKEAAQKTISRIINKAEDEDLSIASFQLKNHSGRRKIWFAAASVLVAVLAGWFWINNRSTNKVETKQEAIEAKKGSRTRSILPDGTTVSLNAGSKLYFDDDFSGPVRNVRLEGEAFFDVTRDPDRPFIVHTAGIDIKVLGTAFNVKSYPEDTTVETTLYRGSVKVYREQEPESKAIHLKPNQKLSIAKQAAIQQEVLSSKEVKPSSAKGTLPASYTIALIDSTKKESERFETAWLYSRLEFRSNNFEDLAKKLERWYNITIIFNDEKVKQLSFDGSFEGETVEQAFRYLHVANSTFNYKININNHEVSVGSVQ
jgi:transmembrane sensor